MVVGASAEAKRALRALCVTGRGQLCFECGRKAAWVTTGRFARPNLSEAGQGG